MSMIPPMSTTHDIMSTIGDIGISTQAGNRRWVLPWGIQSLLDANPDAPNPHCRRPYNLTPTILHPMPLCQSLPYSSLWKRCHELRGGMDASQYEDYILALFFTKYVSDEYVGIGDFADITVPRGGSFADVVALKGTKRIGDGINKVIGRLANANDYLLRGVIDRADFNDESALGKGKEMQDRLTKLVAIFEGLDFRANRAHGEDLLGDAYEYLTRRFATQSERSNGRCYSRCLFHQETHRPSPRAELVALRRASLRARTKRHLEQPLYYGGKWWARRLAVTTRWMIKEALNGGPGVVLDPFAGSGTTLGEALRLGHRAIGVEINPYAATLITSSLEPRPSDFGETYRVIVDQALAAVSSSYGGHGGPAGYFWAYEVDCGQCGERPLLLHHPLLVKHAYPERYPRGWVLCPRDRAVFGIEDVSVTSVRCDCGEDVSLKPGRTGRFVCCYCGSALNRGPPSNGPPESVLVAVEHRDKEGRKFMAPSAADRENAEVTSPLKPTLPPAPIRPGYSTDQLLKWGFTDWKELFHPRQAMLASELVHRVSVTDDKVRRRQLALAFSPFFEYHCRLTSFKGLGTGSVRQAFSRPILHPVSISYEINPVTIPEGTRRSGDPRSWYALRTKKAQGALRSLQVERGGEVRLGSVERVFEGQADAAVLCMDSGDLELPLGSVDAIVTDPPYFDRVHYDDLAGPLNAWMSWCLVDSDQVGSGIQTQDGAHFARGLHRAFASSLKALKSDGKLTFTFHHVDLDAWVALAKALSPLPVTGHSVVLIPAEMPNALIKQRARRPISCDAVLSLANGSRTARIEQAQDAAVEIACDALADCADLLSGDVRSAALASGVLAGLRCSKEPPKWPEFLEAVADRVDRLLDTESQCPG